MTAIGAALANQIIMSCARWSQKLVRARHGCIVISANDLIALAKGRLAAPS